MCRWPVCALTVPLHFFLLPVPLQLFSCHQALVRPRHVPRASPLRHCPQHPSAGVPPGPEASPPPFPHLAGWLAARRRGPPSPITVRFAGDGEDTKAVGVECVGRKVGSVGVCLWVWWCAGLVGRCVVLCASFEPSGHPRRRAVWTGLPGETRTGALSRGPGRIW